MKYKFIIVLYLPKEWFLRKTFFTKFVATYMGNTYTKNKLRNDNHLCFCAWKNEKVACAAAKDKQNELQIFYYTR